MIGIMNSYQYIIIRAPDKESTFISIMPISSPNPMFEHFSELSQTGFGVEITQELSIKVDFMHLIWNSDYHAINLW